MYNTRLSFTRETVFFICNSLHFARISENNQNFITVHLSDRVDLF